MRECAIVGTLTSSTLGSLPTQYKCTCTQCANKSASVYKWICVNENRSIYIVYI